MYNVPTYRVWYGISRCMVRVVTEPGSKVHVWCANSDCVFYCHSAGAWSSTKTTWRCTGQQWSASRNTGRRMKISCSLSRYEAESGMNVVHVQYTQEDGIKLIYGALHACDLFMWMLIVHVVHWQFWPVFPSPVQTVQATVAVSYKEVPKINGEPTVIE